MRPTSLIIVADRGSLRAYRVGETATRGAGLTLVQAFELPEVEGDSHTHHATPRSDWPQLEEESNRRICKELAEQIAAVVRQNGVEGWSFAAPASIYMKIVDQLPVEIRERIVEHVRSDLVKTDLAELPEHFRSLQPI
ncbi:MAG: host attachment protein [Chthoniobacterales bacterium]